MWLSEQSVKVKTDNGTETGIVTVSGPEPAAMVDSERRNLRLVTPGGFSWRPETGDEILIIKDSENGKLSAGVISKNGPENIEAGEVLIYSRNSYVHIKNSGNIVIHGNVQVTGSLDAAGGVYSNGTKIG